MAVILRAGFCLVSECWIPTAWRGFAKGWRRGDACSLTTCLSHTISLHGRRKSWEALANMTDGRESASHTPASLPLSFFCLSPKTCFKYEVLFFPSVLRKCWLQTPASTRQTGETQDTSGVPSEQANTMPRPRAWLLNLFSKRNISSDYFYKNPVSLNWASTRPSLPRDKVFPRGQDCCLKGGVE